MRPVVHRTHHVAHREQHGRIERGHLGLHACARRKRCPRVSGAVHRLREDRVGTLVVGLDDHVAGFGRAEPELEQQPVADCGFRAGGDVDGGLQRRSAQPRLHRFGIGQFIVALVVSALRGAGMKLREAVPNGVPCCLDLLRKRVPAGGELAQSGIDFASTAQRRPLVWSRSQMRE